MIEDGDRIAVGLSGGKDSTALFCALKNLQLFYPKKFELVGISVSMGFEEMDFSGLEKLCTDCGCEFKLVETRLYEIIFEERKESNPCSLCAKMRRGILHDTAKELRCNKLALGHHYDDVVETFMLNLFHEGRLGAFLPVTYLSRKDLTMIRPMIYVQEKDVRYFMGKNNLPVINNPCPEDGHTEREKIKQLISTLDKENKGLKHRLFTAVENGGLFVQNEER
jgi:tRNA(Ile)-lysidine synthase TilS/MesJ